MIQKIVNIQNNFEISKRMSTKPMMLLRKVVQNCIQIGEKFICKLCEFSTDSSRGLKTHIKRKHTKEVEIFLFECELCGCKLENKIEIKKHDHCSACRMKTFRKYFVCGV